jgi:hypothetical protein
VCSPSINRRSCGGRTGKSLPSECSPSASSRACAHATCGQIFIPNPPPPPPKGRTAALPSRSAKPHDHSETPPPLFQIPTTGGPSRASDRGAAGHCRPRATRRRRRCFSRSCAMSAADRPGLTETRGKVASPGLPGATRDACAKVNHPALLDKPPVPCSNCGAPRDRPRQRLCHACHVVYQREWKRKRTRDFRAVVRQHSRADRDVGKIPPGPCTVCGDPESELHHPDHEISDLTVWLCRRCHMLWHAHWKSTVLNTFAEWLLIARDCASVRKAEDRSEQREAAA